MNPLLQDDTVCYGSQHAYVVSIDPIDRAVCCTTASKRLSTPYNGRKLRMLVPREEKFGTYQTEFRRIYALITSWDYFTSQLY